METAAKTFAEEGDRWAKLEDSSRHDRHHTTLSARLADLSQRIATLATDIEATRTLLKQQKRRAQ